MNYEVENLENYAIEKLKKWYLEERKKLEKMELFKLNLQIETERLKRQIVEGVPIAEIKIHTVGETYFKDMFEVRKAKNKQSSLHIETETRKKYSRKPEKVLITPIDYKYQLAKVNEIEKYLKGKGWIPIKEGDKILFKEK